MNAWAWVGVGAAVITGGVILYVVLKPSQPPQPAGLPTPSFSGAIDQGSAERTAWVGLFTSISNTAGDIYRTESARPRASAGASVPPDDGGSWLDIAFGMSPTSGG